MRYQGFVCVFLWNFLKRWLPMIREKRLPTLNPTKAHPSIRREFNDPNPKDELSWLKIIFQQDFILSWLKIILQQDFIFIPWKGVNHQIIATGHWESFFSKLKNSIQKWFQEWWDISDFRRAHLHFLAEFLGKMAFHDSYETSAHSSLYKNPSIWEKTYL